MHFFTCCKCIFLHVVRRIIRPLRKIGVPAAAIYDFDVVKHKKVETDEKTLWRAILSSSGVESSKSDRLEKERQHIESEIRKLNKRKGRKEEKGYFKELASDEVGEELSKLILKLLNELRGYGIFIVPIGEVETWLREMPDTHEEVLINLLNKIDQTAPTGFDIWRFIDDINMWVSNPNRKGMFADSTPNSIYGSNR